MKGMGFAALGIALIGCFLWLVGWVCFTFLDGSMGSPARMIGQVTSFLGNLLQFMAIAVAAVGLIVGGKKPAQPAV